MTTKLTIEYDGTDFAGWAAQPGRRSVASELTRALGTVLRSEVELTVAGRTDAGVHAMAQVASYEGEVPRLRSVNALLPPDIAVIAAEAAPEGFDARRDARARSYLYRVHHRREPSPFERRFSLWWPHTLDFDALRACAAALPGTHDFTAFTPTDTAHVHFDRHITSASWERQGDILSFRIEADAFMRHMNRVLVGTMLEVAGGRRAVDDFVRLLAGAPRAEAGATAPPHGLHLAGVRYA